MAVLNNLSFGDSSLIQFIDDGSIVFRPKHNATVAGIEVAGFLQFDQQAAPAVAPAGSARLYFDTGAQTIQQSLAGGAYATLGIATSISQGGGSVTVTAGGAITLTASATGAITITGANSNGTITIATTGAITLTGGGGQTLTLNSTGDITTLPAAGSTSAIKGGGAGTNQFLAGTDGTMTIQSSAGKAINLNGASSSSISLSTAGAITITPASGQLATGAIAIAPLAGMTWIAPLGYTNTNAALATGANTTVLYLIYIPFNLTVNTMAINVVTPLAAAHVGIGFYTYAASQASATFLGGATFSIAAGGRITASPTAFTLTPGWYWYAWTKDTATNTESIEGLAPLAASGSTLAGGAAGARPFASGATASAAGVLPGTTGTINAFGGSQIAQIPACAINQ